MSSIPQLSPGRFASSRRNRLIPALLAVLAMCAILLAPSASAGVPRVDVCHGHSQGEWQLLSLPTKGNAVNAHLRHGDGLPGREVPAMPGFSFDENCVPVSNDLLILQWQAPFQLNSYLSTGTRDLLAASLVLEPLAEVAADGSLVPVLAVEIPTESNGGISADLTEITWTLRNDVVWSDGTAFTADDAVLTFEFWDQCPGFCSNQFDGVTSVEALDATTVRVTFDDPTPYPYEPFVGYASPILQRAQMEPCVGISPFDCFAEHTMPIGTGPYVVASFDSEQSVGYEANALFRGAEDGLPFFKTVTIDRGGDAEENARAVLEDGIADFAWNLAVAVEPDVLAEILLGGQGELVTAFSTNVEHINLNQTDPDGVPPSGYDNGANPNPFFFENTVLHDALSLAIDRAEIVEMAYAFGGVPTCNMWNVGTATSTNNDACLTQDIAAANALLDANGYLDTDNDGVRETPSGAPLEFDFVTSTNEVRQIAQGLIQGYWEQIGVATNMMDEEPAVFFSPGSGVSIWEFFTDIQMFTNGAATPDATGYLEAWTIPGIPDPVTNPFGPNIPRLASAEYDALHAQLAVTPLDDPGRDDLVIELNDLLVSYATIPLVLRGAVSAVGDDIVGLGEPNAWDSEYSTIENWSRSATP